MRSIDDAGDGATVPMASSFDDEVDDSAVPERIGRFEVRERIGVGGMGLVYAAYDPQLDRIVALKLLRRDGKPEGQTRLLREARSMAQIRHENVVTVFDVGVHEPTDAGPAPPFVFVAMERIDGYDLRHWLEKTTRSRTEILDAFAQAGRGLAAAHAGGVVHRDFKPANVMVDASGTIKVLDFGLARDATRSAGGRGTASSLGSESEAAPVSDVTRDGQIVGTPKYMAPEQHLGEEATAAADQYAFCIALYEALVGQSPFPASDYRKLVLAKTRTQIAEPRAWVDLPDWLQTIVRRGLSPRAEHRFASMNALLLALRRWPGQRSRRRKIALGSVVGVAILAGAWALHDDPPSPCRAGQARMDEVWSGARIDALADRAAARGSLSERAWERTRPVLQEFADAWQASAAAVCADVDSGFDGRLDCLVRRLESLDAAVRVLEEADDDVWINAHQVALALSSPRTCTDARDDEPFVPSDLPLAVDIEEVRRSLEWANARMHGGDVKGAQDIAAVAVARADTIGFRPLVAEAYLRLGRIRLQADEIAQADDDLRTAYFAAKDVGHVEVEIGAASMLVQTSSEIGDFESARTWVRHAKTALDRAGWPASEHLRLLHAEAAMLQDEGRSPDAITKLREALAIAHTAGLRDIATTSVIENNLAYALFEQGHYEEALEQHLSVLAKRRAELGDHPYVVSSLNNVGHVLNAQGRSDEALDYHLEALDRARRIFGEEHTVIADTLNSVALVRHAHGENAAAEKLLEQALAIALARQGDDGPLVAQALSNLGSLAHDRGDDEMALRHYERALAAFERGRGASHPRAASVLHNIGNLHLDRGDITRAVEYFERAIEIRERSNGPDDAKLAFPLTALGRALRELDRVDESRDVLERALAIRSQAGIGGEELALTRWQLARTLATDPRERDRARALAEEAREGFAIAAQADPIAEIDAWLPTLR